MFAFVKPTATLSPKNNVVSFFHIFSPQIDQITILQFFIDVDV